MKYLKYFENLDEKLYKIVDKDPDKYQRIKSTENIPFSEGDIKRIRTILDEVKLSDYQYGIADYTGSLDSSILIYELSKEHIGETKSEWKITQFSDEWFLIRKVGGMHSVFMIDGWDGLEEVLTEISNRIE